MLSISVSLVAVFIPILLMGGIVGRLFREFAVTLSVAIGVSMVVSLTTTPMMCATLLKPQAEEQHGWLYQRQRARSSTAILGSYETTLGWVLRHQFITLLVTLATIGFTVYLYVIVPKGFFPQQDTGRLTGNIQADQDTSFQAMEHLLKRFAAVVSDDPAVAGVIAFTGGSGSGAANAGRMFVTLKPLGRAARSAPTRSIGRLRPQAGQDSRRHVCSCRRCRTCASAAGPAARSTSTRCKATTSNDLNVWGPQAARARCARSPGLVDVNSDQQNRGLQAGLTIDRSTAARLGISPQAIDDTLYDAFGQRQVSTMYMPLNQYHVVMEVEPEFWQNPDALRHLYVRGADGAQVPHQRVHPLRGRAPRRWRSTTRASSRR